MLGIESILKLFVHFEEAPSCLLRQQLLSLEVKVGFIV